ncbi:hypothetical protein M406DRAFT_94101 [Cryphonectria parasitica EP155]|uniref:White collar 1 protein n=1 Tax=Cryphonectria parasitica (strain ATCC 38755 / EP155) TaxID=660469 RepID=A0A9P4XYV6_CRYP1|nr:uncharacterized protein M406DRAFT_94101 [Cryphonectria parasitica EP155]KAF3763065.1 hypothetical protein M406DRAFT_94101 [Cryphonectria parasitica EP155]
MNRFYNNQQAPEHLRRQLQAARQQRSQQQQQQQQEVVEEAGSSGNFNMQQDVQHSPQHDQRSPRNPQAMMPPMGSDTSMMGGDSIDDIISQNTAAETRRRRSVPQPFPPSHIPTSHDDADRRMSMLEFGSGNDDFRGFQFGDQLPTVGPSSTMADSMATYGNMTTMASPLDMQSTASFNHSLGMPNHNDFSTISPDVMSNMMSFSNLNMGSMAPNPNAMTMFSNTGMSTQFDSGLDAVQPDFSMDINPADDPMSATVAHPPTTMGMDDGDEEMLGVSQAFTNNGSGTPQQQSQQGSGGHMSAFSMTPTLPREASNATSFRQSAGSPLSQGLNTARPSMGPETPTASAAVSGPLTKGADSPESNVYSRSGFDMIRALYYVSTRSNPQIQLGAVDFSCAFVVCDVTMNDCPIIYVSDNFQNLTGYSRHDIVGQNCRFLQAPDGKVEAGTKREFVENISVWNLKRKIQEGKECQQGLINYRKGGKPFLNLLTMIPIPWDNEVDIRYFIGFQIDLVECPDAIAGKEKQGSFPVNYKHSDIGQYIWTPPPQANQWDPESGQTLGLDDVSTLLQQYRPGAALSDWHKQSWDKMLLENADDVVHVLSLKGLFLYLSPSCKKILEYDPSELVGNPISSICHPSDIVPITRELKDTAAEKYVNIVFRVRRKESGYTWFESHGSLFVEQGKGRKCIILVGRKRPVFALSRREIEANGGIGDGELWTKLSTSGMFLFVSSNVRSLLDLQPDQLVGTSIQDYMRKETRPEFGRAIEKARRGKVVSCKHEVQNRRGQVLQASTVLYPGDAAEGQKPTFLLAQTKLLKPSSRALAPAASAGKSTSPMASGPPEDPTQPSHGSLASPHRARSASGPEQGIVSAPSGGGLPLGTQDLALASDDNIFEELKTTRCSSWQFELRQMEKVNRLLAEQLGTLLSNKKKRKRRKGVGNAVRDCANCHTRNTPEWRRGPSGNRDLCNSCGLRWAKQTGRVSPRTSSRGGDGYSKKSSSPNHSSPLHREITNIAETPAGGSQAAISSNDGSKAARSQSTSSAPNAATSSHSSAVGGASSSKGLMPPPSQPQLEGGAGTDGHSMSMTSIREEDTML